MYALEKEKTMNCEQCLSLAVGNTGEFYFIFFSGNVCQFSTYFKENENLILYSEKKNEKWEKDRNMLRMHSLSGKHKHLAF